MTPQQPPEPSEAIVQARAKAQQLAAAFEETFGQPKKRTPSQQLVLQHLQHQAGEDSPSYQFNAAGDGISKIAAGIHRDGAKTLLMVIDRQLSIALKNKQPKAAKPKTVR